MQLTYRHTRLGCFAGYVNQAIVNNLSPLLFLTFQQQFSISLTQISFIITLNFAIQMTVDLLSAKFVDRIGYRKCILGAHFFATVGLLGLSIFPFLFAPYAALLLATCLSAIGGGLLEVLVSPMVEALPSENKESEMSLLHSFYCWGHMGVVILSTGYFLLFGTENWKYLPIFWAIIPFLNGLIFLKAPLCTLEENHETMPLKRLVIKPIFWLFLLLMLCSGASELSMSQWASLFAEEGLRVSKTTGDLLGPCFFALTMGISRILFSRLKRITVSQGILYSSVLCVISYAITVFSPWPLVSLIGCGISGFAVGIMWPGVYSVASQHLPAGGTAMFALLALAGDIGCCVGPSIVGAVSDGVMQSGASLMTMCLPSAPLSQAALKTGFLWVMLFPAGLILGMLLLRRLRSSKKYNH